MTALIIVSAIFTAEAQRPPSFKLVFLRVLSVSAVQYRRAAQRMTNATEEAQNHTEFLFFSVLLCGFSVQLCVTAEQLHFPNVLDQFLGNKNLLIEGSAIKLLQDTAQVIRFPEMVDPGEYPKPIPFGGMGKPINQNGFSDHFPIGVTVWEAD
jgi:hypothetical protein